MVLGLIWGKILSVCAMQVNRSKAKWDDPTVHWDELQSSTM